MARTKDYQSAFDIIGPVMMGPSSSHTAGAVKIGQAAVLSLAIHLRKSL